MAPANGQQVYIAVVEAIQQRIADGEWQPGHRLPSINQLAQELGTSTGPVREAARVLASRGLLRIEHGRGIFVTAVPDLPLDLYHHVQRVETGSVLELFEARRVLEPELAALAAERGSSAEIQEIYELAVMMDQSATIGQDFVEPDIQFHQKIATAAKNAVLAGMMAGLNDVILEGRKLTVALRGMTPRAVRYHLLIAEAIRDRRPLQARLLMLAHVNDAIDSLLHAQPQGWNDYVEGRSSSSAVIIGSPAIERLQERPN